MNTLSALSSNPAAVTAVPAPGAAVPGAPTPAGATDEGEVLSVAELLRLLEQGVGPDALPAGTALPPDATGSASAATGTPEQDFDATTADDDRPCDVVTLLRLLEHAAPPPVAAPYTVPIAAAAPLAGAAVTDGTTGTGAGSAPRTRAAPLAPATPTAPAAPAAASVLPVPGDPAVESITAAAAAGILSVPGSATAPDRTGERAGQHDSTQTVLAPAPSATLMADPARAAVELAQSLRALPASSAPPERAVPVPVRDAAWPQAIAAEIRFMAAQKVEAATLRLAPEHLGPLEVRLDVRDGHVNVSFGVAHPETQAALEQALPRLREMFATAGLQLGQANVQQETRRGSHHGTGRPVGDAAAADNGAATAPDSVRALGLIDDYV
ncbi:MAG: flagellar hook-length control protein FliK [Gammaproteobacteria bacterium]|nr:flagellar hook-length control protein FliK [Gammaproteobacteria bacterium]